MTATLTARWEILPTKGPLGAFITGFDARKPAPEDILRLKHALWEHHILIFKAQRLTEDELIAFATHFVPLFVPPAEVPVLGSAQGTPTVVTVANTAEGLLGYGEITPHSDHHWTPYPSSGSLLYALETPSQGGETRWTNLVKAYHELDAATKEQIEGLKAITYNPFLRKSSTEPFDRSLQPPHLRFAHPLVRTHPDRGKKILYLSDGYDVEIVGLEPAESQALVARLRRHLLQPRFVYSHQWSVGDIVYWDNQATLHARSAFDNAERRVLKRVSLAGSRPF